MKAVVLAAGEGTRIRRVTHGAVPKELLPIENVPTIRFPIHTISLAGIKDILVVIAPKTKHDVVDTLRSGEALGVNLCYVVQEKYKGKNRGMGSAILSTKPWILKDEDFIVACGDSIVCDFSSKNPFNCLSPLLKIHSKFGPLASILLYPTVSDPSKFGVAKLKGLEEYEGNVYGEVEKLIEKPPSNVSQKFMLGGVNYTMAGYYIFKWKIFSYIVKTKPDMNNEVQITDSMELAIENRERICAVVHGPKKKNTSVDGAYYWDVGLPEEYKEANIRLSSLDLDSLMKRGEIVI